jgi:TPR repeat protein
MSNGKQFFELGMMYSTGQLGWFNIAAMRGDKEALRLRHEIAAEMSEAEIAAAQRAARDWLTRH